MTHHRREFITVFGTRSNGSPKPILVDATGAISTTSGGGASVATVVAFTAPVTVDVLTSLVAAVDLSLYKTILFCAENSGANALNLFIETSQRATYWDRIGGMGDLDNPIIIPAGVSGSVVVGPEELRKYWRLSGTVGVGSTLATAAVFGVLR